MTTFLSKEEKIEHLIESLSAMATWVTIERDFESELGEHFKVIVCSDFLDNGEQVYYGQNLFQCVTKAAAAWRKQCTEQAQLLEAVLEGFRMWKPVERLVEKA